MPGLVWSPTSLSAWKRNSRAFTNVPRDRKSTRLNSSHTVISYAVFCLKKKKTTVAPRPPDGRSVRGAVGDIHLAGFFAARQLGTDVGQNFIHRFTTSALRSEHGTRCGT